MSKAEFARVEKALGITLPAVYIAAMQKVLKSDLKDAIAERGFLFTDLDRLIEINLDCRKNPKKYIVVRRQSRSSGRRTFSSWEKGATAISSTRGKRTPTCNTSRAIAN